MPREPSEKILFSPGEKTWGRRNADATYWAVAIETDCFNEVDGPVVSLCVESQDSAGTVESLAEVSPEQAREMAAHLIRCAEAIEATR